MLVDSHVIINWIELWTNTNLVEDFHDTSVDLSIEKTNLSMSFRLCSSQYVKSSRLSCTIGT